MELSKSMFWNGCCKAIVSEDLQLVFDKFKRIDGRIVTLNPNETADRFNNMRSVEDGEMMAH